MIGVAVEFLTGVYRAAARQSREMSEWPPHPDRLFMAFVAGHHECRGSESDVSAERAALTWIERAAPPSIAAPARHDRTTANCFVPTNDDGVSTKLAKVSALKQKGLDDQLRVLPSLRGKKARRFPAVVPTNAVIHFVWKEPCDDVVRRGLSLLCAKLTRLGHSTSLVRAWLEDAPPACNLEPCDKGGDFHLRVPTLGRLTLLEHLFEIAPEKLPVPAPSRGYQVVVRSSPPVRSTLAGSFIVLQRVAGTRIGLKSGPMACEVLRRTVMQRCPVQPPPEWMSGHASDGSPSRSPHIAVVPLAMVDGRHADGHLLGLGVLVPQMVSACERRAVLEAALTPREGEQQVRLWNGDWFEWTVEPLFGTLAPKALTSTTWTGPESGSLVWGSVTPVVLDRHAKDERGIASTIAESCVRVGLPTPKAIGLSRSCVFSGSVPSHRFPVLRRPDGSARRHLHVLIEFDQPVIGPIVIGAGRFSGYGLLKPILGASTSEVRRETQSAVIVGLQGRCDASEIVRLGSSTAGSQTRDDEGMGEESEGDE